MIFIYNIYVCVFLQEGGGEPLQPPEEQGHRSRQPPTLKLESGLSTRICPDSIVLVESESGLLERSDLDPVKHPDYSYLTQGSDTDPGFFCDWTGSS